MAILPPKTTASILDPTGARLSSLEQRLAALESVISATPNGDLTINVPGNLTISVGRNVSATVSQDLVTSIGKSFTSTIASNYAVRIGGAVTTTAGKTFNMQVGQSLVIEAGGVATFASAWGALMIKPNGDVLLEGNKINIQGSSDLTLKGSKITQN